MKKEIGGYFDFEEFNGAMLHEGAVTLNSGRSCLAYLIITKKIEEMLVPDFYCGEVVEYIKGMGVKVIRYEIDESFRPMNLYILEKQWLLLVDYYGQLEKDDILYYKSITQNLIVDEVQGYFKQRVSGVCTFYSCRKFFGVSDGAFLYTDELLKQDLLVDESYKRIMFVLGRFERSAPEFYKDASSNNHSFQTEPIKKMSKLTYNILHGLDYKEIERKRFSNFMYVHEKLKEKNGLKLIVPDGPFMYPFYSIKADQMRELLCKDRIYIPRLWPDIYGKNESSKAKEMAQNILPLPIDQRYGIDEMKYMISKIQSFY